MKVGLKGAKQNGFPALPGAVEGEPPPSRYRWIVLAVGSMAAFAFAAAQSGMPALGPILQQTFSLSVVQVSALFTALSGGVVLTVLAWGAIADRFGERASIAGGLLAGAVALVVAAWSETYLALMACLVVLGMFGASTIAPTGRAVFGIFPNAERGFALGIRQTALPVGAAVAAFGLPSVALAFGLDAALYILAGLMGISGIAAALLLRRRPKAAPRDEAPAPRALRDARIWRLSVASAMAVVAQIGVTTLVTIYLYNERGWSVSASAMLLGTVHLGGAFARIAVGRWSDQVGSRIRPFRTLTAFSGSFMIAVSILADAPGVILVPVLVLGGIVAMSWNGLSLAAAAEVAGMRQAGTAMGMQNTVLRGMATVVPVALGALATATSWRAIFVVMGIAPFVARAMLTELVIDEDRRRKAAVEMPLRG